MKKYLFILMGVLSIFFFDNSVNALSFTVNDVEYTVDSEEKIFDYCYYTYIKGTEYSNSKFLLTVKGSFIKFLYTNLEGSFYNSSGYLRFSIKDSSELLSYNSITFALRTTGYEITNTSTSSNTSIDSVSFSNVDIFDSYYFNNIYFNSNRSNSIIESTYGSKNKYTINYYIDNDLYKSVEVEEGTNYTLIEYLPPKNYNFSGWSYDENIDLTNITSDINIYGTTSYVRPDMNYSENIDSVIHELSVSIIGKNVPVEFDYIYTIMDFIILLVLVVCVVMPFVILIKILGGGF